MQNNHSIITERDRTEGITLGVVASDDKERGTNISTLWKRLSSEIVGILPMLNNLMTHGSYTKVNERDLYQ